MNDLEYRAARWLKFEKRCTLVMCERSPRTWWAGEPDVIGINPSRFLFEIEVKRTMADFRANQKKRHMQNRFSLEMEIAKQYSRKAPKHFWFLVPEKLADKALAEVPDFAGLMIPKGGYELTVVKKSPANNDSEKLSLLECGKLLQCAGNQIISMMAKVKGMTGHFTIDPHAMDDFYTYTVPKYSNQPCQYLNFQI